MTITDGAVLAAIAEVVRIRSEEVGQPWTIGASRWDIAATLAGHPEDVGGRPSDYATAREEVVRTKLAEMTESGLIDGCACGCRGDFVALQTTPR